MGRSAASGRAAKSHTGALVTPLEVVDAAVAEAGALRLDTAGELVDAAPVLLGPGMRGGHRVAVVADGGGQGALAADVLAAAGLSVPPLSEATMSRLRHLLPVAAGVTNPVDLAGAGESDIGSYAAVVGALLTAPDADAVVLSGYFGDYATSLPEPAGAESAVASAIADLSADVARPVAVHSMATTGTAALHVLRGRGIPVFERIEQAAAAVANAARWAALSPAEVPPFIIAPPAGDGSYQATRELLAGYGLSFPAATFVTDADSAAAAATAMVRSRAYGRRP